LLPDQIQLNAGPIPHKIKRGQSDALFMIKPSGSIARKRKKRRKKTRSRRALYFVSKVLKVPKADSGASKPAIIATKSWDWQARLVLPALAGNQPRRAGRNQSHAA
jgi:hypothetical protein